MSKKRKHQVGRVTRGALMTLLVAMTVFTAVFLSTDNKASAIDGTQWETLRGYIQDYFGGAQYDPARGGTAGFTYNKVDLQAALDSNDNISPKAGSPPGDNGVTVTGVLGEGDDAANAPILIDNLMGQTNIIPGTSFRCNWSTDDSCFSEASVTMVRELVDAHKAAGFSTDIVDYCVSSHTGSPTTGGWGIIAQTGALSSDGDVPNVYLAEWSRNGWRNNTPAPLTTANSIAAAETSTGYSNPTPPSSCTSETTDGGLARCMANWAIASNLGNVGNGQSTIATIEAAGQTVDTRPGSISTLSTAGDNYQVPINELFSLAGLNKLDPTKTTIVVPESQQGGPAAIGLKMLGYDMVAGGFINLGIPRWNSTQGEQEANIGDNLPTQSIISYPSPGKVETTAPVISSVVATPTTTGAVITWTTDEPATTRLKWDLDGTPYTNDENDTILKTSHSFTITGQTAPATIYYEVSAYDGYANSDVEAEATVDVVEGCQTADDYCYYSTWYDAVAADGWQGDWIDICNLAGSPVEVDVLINSQLVDSNAALASYGTWTPSFPGMMAGPVEVICRDCKPNDKLVVSQRVLFKNTFNEVIMPERADLGTSYKFPWYDNYQPSGMLGDWIMMTNTDPSAAATVDVEVCGAAVSGSPFTIPAGTSYPIQLPYGTTCGPVSVTGQGAEKLLVTQRVLFWDSFNEVIGYKSA